MVLSDVISKDEQTTWRYQANSYCCFSIAQFLSQNKFMINAIEVQIQESFSLYFPLEGLKPAL